MSAKNSGRQGKATIYDEEGRTRIPNSVRDALGWEKGDEVEMVVMNGHLYVNKLDKED